MRQIARSCAYPEEIKMLQIRMGVPQPKRAPPPKRTNLQNLAAAVGTVSAVTVPPKRAKPEAVLGVAEADTAAAPPPPKKRPPPKRAKATDEAILGAAPAAEPVEAESPAVKTKRQPPPKMPKAEGVLGSESATESASSAELASATVESTRLEALPQLPKKKPPPKRSQS